MKSPFPVQFGDPTPQHLQAMSFVPGRFGGGALKGITVAPPPEVGSDEVRQELMQTREHVASPRLDPRFCEEVDEDMVPAICEIAGSHGVVADPDEIRELIDDLIPVILRLKFHFNFPRPWQISAAAGPPLLRLSSPSAQTPSYPSGHAMQAGAACALLGERFPHALRELDRISAAVGLSRLQLGVHFPMDIVVGLRAGRQIGRRIA